MKNTTKLIMIGGVIAGVKAYRSLRRQPATPARDARDALRPDHGAAMAAPVGLSSVDPQPLTNPGAEAIDPDATRAAHDDVEDQRARLPVAGENVP
jgi:hypothetical protein